MRRAMISVLVALAFGATVASDAKASGDTKLPAHEWSFHGIFGTFDRAELRRGLQVYREICASCHGLSLVAFRHLGRVGFSEDEIKAVAADYEVGDGPNDEGEMFTRAGKPSDFFVPPFANEKAARAANAGAFPPDLSLITKARKHGPDYLHALLTGYQEEAPEGVELMDGMSYNPYFPGRQIAMPPPLSDDAVEYADGTKATVDQMATDLVTFLAWTAQPELEERKRLGIKVMLFLIVLTAMLYALKRKIWADVH